MTALTHHVRAAIDACATPGAQPLPSGSDGEPVFADPWQAQAFASTVALSQRGLFNWKEWVEVFSAEIAAHPQAAEESAADAYFRQWLRALETILVRQGVFSGEEVLQTHEHWRRSYVNTAHGQPVQFSRAWAPPSPEVERWLSVHRHGHHHDHEDDHENLPRPIAVSPARELVP